MLIRAWNRVVAQRILCATVPTTGIDPAEEASGTVPRGGAGRRAAVPLSIGSIAIMMAGGVMGLLVQLYLRELGAAPIIISLSTSLGAAGLLIGSVAWGAASDRIHRKPLLFATAAGVAVTVGVLAFLPSAGVVLPVSLLREFVRTGFVAMTMALVSAASVTARRGRNLSYLSASRSLGFGLGAAVGGFVLEALGFRWSYVVLLVLPTTAVLSMVFLPSEPVARLRDRTVAWRLAARAGLTDLYIGTILRQMAIHGTFSLIFVYMANRGISPGLMGLLSSTNMATQTLAMLFFGRLADRIGRRRIFLLGFALSVAVPLAFALASTAWQMALGYVLLGLSFSSLYMGSTAHIG
ncbi:MAG: MFS transporter, partial [Candidatus Bipolaricaulota bacterium]